MIISSEIGVSNTNRESDKINRETILKDIKPVDNDSNFVGTLYPILKTVEVKCSIPRLSATFGNAFSFSMKKGNGVVWQHANIDWWLFWEMINYIGVDFNEYQMILNGIQPPPTPNEIQDIKKQTWNQVKESIDNGIPAIAWQPMTTEQRENGVNAFGWGLLVGYNDLDKTYIVRHQTHRIEYHVPYNGFGYSDPVQWYCVMVPSKLKTVDATNIDITILKHAVDFADGKRFNLDKAPYKVDTIGFDAYKQWINLIESGNVDIGFTEHSAWMLWEMRQNAQEYLLEITNQFNHESRQSITEAATYYKKEINEIVKLVNLCKEHDQFTNTIRQEAISILNAALDYDKKAIGKIKEFLESINLDSN
ncbi:hypothetical protein JT359_11220 [Candidatus Poribacteria bacterium]|nr:hypothetical protein [Candidatus Poribacteria bacterium]